MQSPRDAAFELEKEWNERSYAYVAPPPNDYCISLSELKFGRRDYEEDMHEHERKISVMAQKVGQKKARETIGDWRDAISNDRYAMMLICEDPKFWMDGTSFKTPFPWNPNEFQNILLNDAVILEIVMLAATAAKNPDISAIMQKVERKFKKDFMPITTKHWEETKCDLSEYYLDKMKFFETMFIRSGSIITARFLLGLYFMIPEYWTDKAHLLTGVIDKIHIPKQYSKTGSNFILKPKEGKVVITVDGISKGSSGLTGVVFKKRKDNG